MSFRVNMTVIFASVLTAAAGWSADGTGPKLTAADIRVTLEADVVHVNSSYTLDEIPPGPPPPIQYPITKETFYVEIGGFTADAALTLENVKRDYGVTLEKPINETRRALPLAAGYDGPWTDFRATVDAQPIKAELVERNEIISSGRYEEGQPTYYLQSTRWVEWSLPKGTGGREVKISFADGYETYGVWYLSYYTIPVCVTKGWAGPLAAGKIVAEFSPALGCPIAFRGDALPPAEVAVTAAGTAVTWDLAAADPARGSEAVICIPFATGVGEGPRAGALELAGLDAEHAGYPGRVDVDNINFRMQPSADAPRVAARPTLMKDEYVYVFESRGEWYRAETADGAEGWVRWRYVDPDTHTETVYVKLDYDSGA
jgi:hypothetical protein